MWVSEVRIETDRPNRYLVQFCRHASGVGQSRHGLMQTRRHGGHGGSEMRASAQWTKTDGVVTFIPGGRCLLAADVSAGVLTVRLEADDEQAQGRLQGIVSRNFARFLSREAVEVSWVPVQG